jgi:hypothetical protein
VLNIDNWSIGCKAMPVIEPLNPTTVSSFLIAQPTGDDFFLPHPKLKRYEKTN